MNEKLVELAMQTLLEDGLGLSLDDPNLTETPKRVAKMYCREFFKNVGKEFSDWKDFPNKEGYDQIIMADKVSFVSTCSHHFLPFTGFAYIAYIPDKKLVGVSKLARVIEHYSARPQIQENLCHEIINCFNENIKPKGSMILMKASHNCMAVRGVKQPSSNMVTSVVSGIFKTNSLLEEKVLSMIKL